MPGADIIAQQVNALTAVNTSLYSDVWPAAGDDIRAQITNWNMQARVWQGMAGAIADGSNPRVQEWGALGGKLAAMARDIATAAAASSTLALISAFVAGMPAALRAVASGTVDGAAAAVNFTLSAALSSIPWPVWAALGVVSALGLYLVAKHTKEIISR